MFFLSTELHKADTVRGQVCPFNSCVTHIHTNTHHTALLWRTWLFSVCAESNCSVSGTMEWFRFFVVGWSLLVTSIADETDPGSVKLEDCSDSLIDLPENGNKTFVCSGFTQNANIVWSIERNDQKTPVATCNADSNCTGTDHFAVQRSPSHSQLNYSQYDSSLDINTEIECKSQIGNRRSSEKCKFNVIRQATLPHCVVGIAAENSTAGGICQIEGAFSSSRSFTCTWYLKDSKQIRIPGNISYTINSMGSNGWCTFLKKDIEIDLENSTYSILFYPGPGKMKVNSMNVELNMLTGDLRNLLPTDKSSAAAALAFGCLGVVFLSVIVGVNAVIT